MLKAQVCLQKYCILCLIFAFLFLLEWDLSHPMFGGDYASVLKTLRTQFMSFFKGLFSPAVDSSRRSWRKLFWRLVDVYDEASRGFRKLLTDPTPENVTVDFVDLLFQIAVSCVNKILGAAPSKKQKGNDGLPVKKLTDADRFKQLAGDIFNDIKANYEKKQRDVDLVKVKNAVAMPEKSFADFNLSELAPQFSTSSSSTHQVPSNDLL